jgi:hypothetical protein
MAIEDSDIRDRKICTGIASQWYSRASEKVQIFGRLYYCLAAFAKTNGLQQLFYYSKPLRT